MPFPIIAALTLAVTAAAARDQVRSGEIQRNQQRREADMARRELQTINEQTNSTKRQTLQEQDQRLPFQLSLPSKASGSYEEVSTVNFAGTPIPTNYLLIGGVGLIVLLVLRKAV